MKRLLLALVLGLAACSSSVDLTYRPSMAAMAQTRPVVAIGDFTDQRGEVPTYLGTIRGGFGNPLKRLYTNRPLSDVVEKAFQDGLAARGLLSQDASAPYRLGGEIVAFDCNQVIRREADASIRVELVENSSGRIVMTRTFKAYQVSGGTLATGMFGSLDSLREIANQALQQIVDQALDNADFKAAALPQPALQGAPAAPAS